MKRIKKFIAPLILSFLLLGTFFISTSQNANARTITITIGGGKSGLQYCDAGGLICVVISANAVVADIVGDADLMADHLTLRFTPNDMLKGMTDTERKLVVNQDVSFDSSLCQYFGVPEITILAGTYDIKLDGCNAEIVLNRKQ